MRTIFEGRIVLAVSLAMAALVSHADALRDYLSIEDGSIPHLLSTESDMPGRINFAVETNGTSGIRVLSHHEGGWGYVTSAAPGAVVDDGLFTDEAYEVASAQNSITVAFRWWYPNNSDPTHVRYGWFTVERKAAEIAVVACAMSSEAGISVDGAPPVPHITWQYEKGTDGVVITDCEIPDGFGDHVDIPSALAGLPVVEVGGGALMGKQLVSVRIPSSVRTIGYGAFFGCSLLEDVTIEGTDVTIWMEAFESCPSLRRFIVDDIAKWCSFTVWDRLLSFASEGLYLGDERVVDLVIPEGVRSFSGPLFSYGEFRSVSFPSTLTSAPADAFANCGQIGSVTTAAGGIGISGLLWDSRKTITNVTYAAGVTRVGNGALKNLDNLTSVRLPETVEEIGDSSFSGLKNLSAVELPDGLRSIGQSAFEGCTSITNVSFPASLKSIGKTAFHNCTNLVAIFFAGDAPDVGGNAFSGVRKGCVVTVATLSRGWGVEMPGKWNGMRIERVPCDVCTEDDPEHVPATCADPGKEVYRCRDCERIMRTVELKEEPHLAHVCQERIKTAAAYQKKGWADYYCKFCGTKVFSAETPADPYAPGSAHFSSRPATVGEGPYYEMADGIKWRYYVTNGVAFVRYEEYWTPAIPIDTVGEVVVPRTLGRWPLTMLVESPFAQCEGVTSIVIHEGVTNLDNCVFYATLGLERIVFEGDAPVMSGDPFYRTWATIYVKPGSKGWHTGIPGPFNDGGMLEDSVKIDYLMDASGETTLRDARAANPKFSLWDCYVAGLDAENTNAELKVSIDMEDGVPKVTCDPDLGASRTYTVYGSSDLKSWTPDVDPATSGFRFFKVGVSMPTSD